MTPEELARELALLREFGYTHLDLGTQLAEANPIEVSSRRTADDPDSSPKKARKRAPSIDDAAQPIQPIVRPAASDAKEGAPDTGSIIAAATLGELESLALPCKRCRLANTRTQVVFGSGNPNADLMFVGEAPGRDEDIQGKPFVGRAGQLLTDIIKAMKLSRDDVYIANVIKCRPPENRNPEPDELDACRPYIRRQVEMIQPKVIVTLGRFGLQSLTEKAYSISSVRGKWLEFNGIKLMPTYHPAYLLRNPSAKKDVWQDMKQVMAELGIEA